MTIDEAQEQQLREWAQALSERDDPERRAVGRAMVMMLDEIAMLRARLARVVEAEDASEPAPPDVGPGEPEPTVAIDPDQDTVHMRLRDRIRHAADRLGHDDD